jgi:C-terminal processing protease CtpA/Prc
MKNIKLVGLLYAVIFLLIGNTIAQDDIISQWFAMQMNPPKDTPETRQKTFDTAWKNFNDNHFEADFNGIDWDKISEKYAPLVTNTKNDEELFILLNQMLCELKRSHNYIVSIKRILQGDTTNNANAGLTVKFIGGKAVVTKVEMGSSAALLGIKKGFILQKINNTDVEKIRDDAHKSEQTSYLKNWNAEDKLRRKLQGEAKEKVTIQYLDEKDMPKTATLQFLPKKGEIIKVFGISPVLINVESRKLEGNIGYLKFNNFLGSKEKVLLALEALLDSSAIILDLQIIPVEIVRLKMLSLRRFLTKKLCFTK